MGNFTPSQPTGSTGTFTSYTSVSGSRATTNTGSSTAKREVDEQLLTHKPYQTPILQELIANQSRRRPTGNQKFEWMFTSLLPQTDTVTLAGGAANQDNITVGDSTLYQVGTKFVVDTTGEVIIVDSIASSQIDVTKIGSGNITAGTSVTVHFLLDSFEQGSSSATAKSVNKEFPFNYVEIFKRSVEETESQQATVEYGANDWNEQRMNRMEEFKYGIERNFLHGIRSSATGVQNGSYTQFYTGGVFDSTANYVQQLYAYSSLTEAYFFDTFLQGWFSRGSDRKRLYCGADVLTAINNFSKVKQQTAVMETVYGVNIQRIRSPYGEVELVWHRMLDGATFTDKAVGLDMGGNYISYRYLAGNGISRDFAFKEYPHLEEQERRKGEWKCEIGFQIQAPEYHAILEPA